MQTDLIERKLLRPNEVAQQLDVNLATVYRAISRGELEAVRLGETGSLRVSTEALAAFLAPAHNEEERR
jgi:excisionase family DNA binding protein